jgi:hypothetical protein
MARPSGAWYSLAMPRTTSLLPFVLVAALAACSSTGLPNSGGPGDGGGGGSSSSGGGSSSGGSGDDAGGSLDVQASIGPIPLAPSEETTVCIVKRLSNPVDMWITDMHVNLAPGSHHLILYTTQATQEDLTPQPCQPFQGIAIGSAVPIILVNKEQVDWTFPQGIALLMSAQQMVRIEAHYINTSPNMLQGMGNVDIHGVAKTAAPSMQKADSLFWGTMNINLPPNATGTTGPVFQQGIAGTHMFSITTHQHRLGTGIQVWESTQSGAMGTQIANDTDWSNPSWKMLAPQFDFNGTNGLTYQCDWNNTTNQTVTFGESALQEMCFVGGFYYPGQGFQVCVPQGCEFR